MTYELDAFVAPDPTAQELHHRVARSTLVPLRGGISLVLGPEELDLLDLPTEGLLDGLTVARVEADFFGGTGRQSAWFYRDGVLAWSDVDNPTSDPDAAAWPINRALADLGHRPTRHATWNPAVLLDCFGDVGLGHCRSNVEWIRFAHAGGDGDAITDYEDELARRKVG
ncbi:hypothetical protein [Cellulomonas taurus]|uniref:hypothetical protein n=1 Tax=Cellulomonas taurus TaxID=2729175 RepID=UPI00145D0FBE|nr:hypothetical protein [Cellulomonas taurus]